MATLVSDFTKDADQIVLDLINNDNETNLPLSAVTFGVPALTEGAEGIVETTLRVSAATGSGYRGFVDVQYNRVDLAFMDTNEPDLVIETEAASVHELLPVLNATFGINLTEDDVEDTAIAPTEADVVSTVTITAKAGSLVYVGSYVLDVTLPLVDLDTVITVTTLDGLYPPEAVAG